VRASGASIGTVEAWFRTTVVAAETVALGSADDGVWTMRAAGGELALVARVEPAESSGPPVPGSAGARRAP